MERCACSSQNLNIYQDKNAFNVHILVAFEELIVEVVDQIDKIKDPPRRLPEETHPKIEERTSTSNQPPHTSKADQCNHGAKIITRLRSALC